jgi:hypothetical protein
MLLGMDKAIDIGIEVDSQEKFDLLFKLIFHHEKNIATRSIDAVEKITRNSPAFLDSHKKQIFALINDDPNIEIKWHLAQIISRLQLSPKEFKRMWTLLTHWAANPNESKIVRVNSLQSLFDLYMRTDDSRLLSSFRITVRNMERERIPSISARIRQLRKQYSRKQAVLKHV